MCVMVMHLDQTLMIRSVVSVDRYVYERQCLSHLTLCTVTNKNTVYEPVYS